MCISKGHRTTFSQEGQVQVRDVVSTCIRVSDPETMSQIASPPRKSVYQDMFVFEELNLF